MVLVVEASLDCGEIIPFDFRFEVTHHHYSATGSLRVVDPAGLVEDGQVEGLAGPTADFLPMIFQELAVILVDDMTSIGTEASHDQRNLGPFLVVFSESLDDVRKSVTPGAHRIADIDDFFLHGISLNCKHPANPG